MTAWDLHDFLDNILNTCGVFLPTFGGNPFTLLLFEAEVPVFIPCTRLICKHHRRVLKDLLLQCYLFLHLNYLSQAYF